MTRPCSRSKPPLGPAPVVLVSHWLILESRAGPLLLQIGWAIQGAGSHWSTYFGEILGGGGGLPHLFLPCMARPIFRTLWAW